MPKLCVISGWYSPYGCKMLHTVENVILLIGFDVSITVNNHVHSYILPLPERQTDLGRKR
ncbi:hypothetical protein C0J52_07586 [Blattella germanica]|nr:hypothetical protein C0J52_07586 [Blattella germanica]